MSQSESSEQEMLSQQDRRSSSSSSEIKNKSKLKRKGRPPSGPKENGLTKLTRKFVRMIKNSKDLTLDISNASKELNIHKRRIYDITNVLEVIGYIQKIRKNQIKWIGEISQHDFDREIDGMKKKISHIEEEEQIYRKRILDMKQAISETIQKHKENLFLTSQDIKNLNEELTKGDPQMQVIFVHASVGSQITVWKNEDGKTNAIINSQPTNLSCSMCIPNYNTIINQKAEKKRNARKLKKQLKQKAKKQGLINPPSKIKQIEKKDENKPKTVSKPKISQASLPKAIPKEKKEIRSRQKSEKKVRQRKVGIKRQRKNRTKENLGEKSSEKEFQKENSPQKKKQQTEKKKREKKVSKSKQKKVEKVKKIAKEKKIVKENSISEEYQKNQIQKNKQQTEKKSNQQLNSEQSKQNEEKINVAQETVNLKINVVIEKKKREKKVSESKQKKVEKVKKIAKEKKIVKEKKIEKEKKIRIKKQQGQRSLSKRGRTIKQKDSQNQNFDIFEEEDQ